MAKKTRKELEAENRLLSKYNQSEAVSSVLITLIKWGGLAFIAWRGFLALETLAGETTVADWGLDLRLFARVTISQLLAWILGISGIGYGLVQQKLRRDTVERVQSRVEELERKLDPGRSSSSLTPRGETRPEDRP